MAEKHLAELGWKMLASKNNIKDQGLGKALVAFSKADSKKDATASLAALDNIETLAKKLSKSCKDNADIKDYLDDMLKEAAKQRKPIELMQKSAEAAGEDDEEDGSDLKSKLLGNLNRVKKGVPRPFMICIAKPDYEVVFAKTIGPGHEKQLKELLPNASKRKFVTGQCVFENARYTFVLDAVPGGLAKGLKKTLKKHTGTSYKIRVRDTAGTNVEDDESEEGEHQKMADDLKATLNRLTKTVNYAKGQEPDEGIRILANVKRDMSLADTAFQKAYPGSDLRPAGIEALLAETDKIAESLKLKAKEQVTSDCKKWLKLFKGPLHWDQLKKLEPNKQAEVYLHYINEVEEGVRRDEGIMKRLGDTSLNAVLGKVTDQMAIARGQWVKLCPTRTSDKPPVAAPPVKRPAPTGVADPEAWAKACDAVDLAGAKGEDPKEEDVRKVIEGAEQALHAAQTPGKWGEFELEGSGSWDWKSAFKSSFQCNWDQVKAHFRGMKNREKAVEFMSGYWWFRKIEVDKAMLELADKYKFQWGSMGSSNLESDYDVSVTSHGKQGEKTYWDYQIVDEFNKKLSGKFDGVQTGTMFDTNLYAEALPPEPKTAEQKTQTEEDMDAMTEAGQDVGALMKLRRYMDWEDYVSLQEETLAGIQQAIKAEKNTEKQKELLTRLKAARRQFEEADALYFQSLKTILLTVEGKAEITNVDSVEGAMAGTIEEQRALIKQVEDLEKDPDKLLAATNEAYLKAMKAVRDIEEKIQDLDKSTNPDPDERSALLARLKTAQTNAIFFAAEAYHTEGALTHIVRAGQTSAQKVKADPNISEKDRGKEIQRLTTEKLEKLTIMQFMQSFNEQLGDCLKDLKHYEHVSPFPGKGFYRSSKYVQRFCEAMIWIGKKLEGTPAHAEFKVIKIAGKTPDALKNALGGLVDLRGGKVEFDVPNAEQEADAYAMEEAQKVYGSSVHTLRDLADVIKEVGRKVNVVLRKAEAGQKLIAQRESAYFQT